MRSAELDGGFDEEVRLRVSELLRLEPVPPAELLEHCCAVLDEAMRSQGQQRGGGGMQFKRMGERAAPPDAARAAPPARAPEPEYGASLPLRSLQPGFANYDARSQAYVDMFVAAESGAADARAPIVDKRRAKIDAFAALMSEAKPPASAARAGTQIGGGYSRSQPLHQRRCKRITVRPEHEAAWGVLRHLVPELRGASEVTITNFPAPAPKVRGAVDASRRPDEDAPHVVPAFVDPQRVDLTFMTAASPNPWYRKVTLEPGAANLLKDMDGELAYEWHGASFTRTATGVYGESGDPNVKPIEQRLQRQQLEKGGRVGDGTDWRF